MKTAKQIQTKTTDTKAADKKAALGKLPNWNLADLYPAMGAPEIEADLKKVGTDAKNFAKKYQGKIQDIDGANLAKAIKTYEQIDELLSKIQTYSYLTYSEKVTDPKRGQFYQRMSERVTEISKDLIFFTLEINKITGPDYRKWLEAPTLAKYRPWLDAVRQYRPHQLPDEVEKILHDRSVVGRAAWNRLYDETLSGLKFDVDGKEVAISEVLNLMSGGDGALRKAAAQALGKTLGDNIKLFALITNTLAKDKEIDDTWRRYEKPVSSRNLSNQVEDEVVDALLTSVKDAYPVLSHRYYALKAKWFGKKQMDYWDRNAPVPGEIDRVIPWKEAKQIVFDAYNSFSPQLAGIVQQFYDKNWIDVPSRAGKDSGAYSHPCVPSVHPYILLNYHGKVRDVMTLAHELGHGVHQYLAGKKQGHLLADTPLTLAETASVFGEMMTFQSLLSQLKNPKDRKVLLARKVEDMLSTVVRQIAFYDFEQRVHNGRRNGELLPEQIGHHWMAIQRESLGPAIKFDDNYQNYWAYIPHFIHSPFYVYAYAFGDCLVNALYAEYQERPQGFHDKYIQMLESGGTKRHKELLKPFNLDATDPKFWRKGLSVIEKMIDELERL